MARLCNPVYLLTARCFTLDVESEKGVREVLKTLFREPSLPVDSPWALVRLDVHLVEVDIHLGDLHLEAVGQQLDGLPHGAIARPPWHGEQGLGPNGS